MNLFASLTDPKPNGRRFFRGLLLMSIAASAMPAQADQPIILPPAIPGDGRPVLRLGGVESAKPPAAQQPVATPLLVKQTNATAVPTPIIQATPVVPTQPAQPLLPPKVAVAVDDKLPDAQTAPPPATLVPQPQLVRPAVPALKLLPATAAVKSPQPSVSTGTQTNIEAPVVNEAATQATRRAAPSVEATPIESSIVEQASQVREQPSRRPQPQAVEQRPGGGFGGPRANPEGRRPEGEQRAPQSGRNFSNREAPENRGPQDRVPQDRRPREREEDRGPENRERDREPENRGDRGPEGRGPEGRGPEGRGPEGRGPEGRGPIGRDFQGPPWAQNEQRGGGMFFAPGNAQPGGPGVFRGLGAPGMDPGIRLAPTAADPDKLLASPMVKRLLELMEQNIELKAQLKIQQIEQESKQRVRELESALRLKEERSQQTSESLLDKQRQLEKQRDELRQMEQRLDAQRKALEQQRDELQKREAAKLKGQGEVKIDRKSAESQRAMAENRLREREELRQRELAEREEQARRRKEEEKEIAQAKKKEALKKESEKKDGEKKDGEKKDGEKKDGEKKDTKKDRDDNE